MTNNDFMSTIKCNVKGGSYTVEVGQSKDILVVHDMIFSTITFILNCVFDHDPFSSGLIRLCI